MLDVVTKNRINTARDILVGKVPDPKSQVEQITIALIYKFMDDMDTESEELGGKRTFFAGDYAKYAWRKIFDPRMSGYDLLNLYSEAISTMDTNPGVPKLFRDIFKNAYLPYRDPETLKSFLKIINEFDYSHSEKLGDAFEFLLSVLGSQGNAGQFRTPRHIIDFMVEIVDPKKDETILDPACGTAGFLISSYKHIIRQNSSNYNPEEHNNGASKEDQSVADRIISTNGYTGDKLSAEQRKILARNIHGYDISPDMVRLSLVNMYLHGIKDPKISEYDTLTSEDNWNYFSDVILANPPFMSPKGGIKPHKRFSVQSNRSEVLFVDYIMEHLTPNGRAAVIVPEGIIFQSGNAYKELRKKLVNDCLVGVISLPAGVFNPYSGVKTSILWLDKSLANKTDNVLFFKIENDGYDLGAQRRAVKGTDLPGIMQKITTYKSQLTFGKPIVFESGGNVLYVARKDIFDNSDYNLSGERYNEKEEKHSVYPFVKLKGLCRLIRGVTYTKSDEVENEGTGILRANNINLTSGQLDFTDIKWINPKVIVKEEQRLQKDDILICTASGSVDHIGKVAFSADNTGYYFGGFMGVLRTDHTKLLPKFLLLMLKSQKFRDFIEIQTVGANIRNLKGSMLDSFEFPLPTLTTQLQFVSEIDSYQKIIDGARQVVENYMPRIDIDPEWEMVELGNVAKPQYGFTERAKDVGNARFIRITDIDTDGKLRSSEAKYIDITREAEKCIVKRNDILVARTGATYGKTMIYEETYPAVFASFLMRLKFDLTKVFPKYYWVFAQSEDYISQAASLMTGGGQPQFNGNAIVKIKLPLPPLDIQQHIVSRIEEEMGMVNTNMQLIGVFEQKIKDRIAKVWGE